MASIIRMGFVGGGHALQEIHLPLFSQMEDVLPLVLCDVREAALKSALRKFGIRETTTHWQDVLSMREIDAVVVTLPNDLHATVAERALRAGKHVLCEKPAALDAAGAEAIQRAVRDTGCIYMTALPYRFEGEAVQLQRLVQAGRLGQVHHVRAGLLRRQARPSGWAINRARSGGGAFLQLGTHLLDLAVWLLDFPELVRVSAIMSQGGRPMRAGATSSPRVIADEPCEVEDSATALLRFEDGRTATIEAAWALDIEEDRQFLEVFGDKGGASLWPLRVVADVDGLPSVITPRCQVEPGYATLARRFVELVHRHGRGERLSLVEAGADDGLRLATMTAHIYKSAEAGREIELAPTSAGGRGARA